MELVLRILIGALSGYMLLMFIRIIITWFGGASDLGRPYHLLTSITDPYLNYFRRFKFLRFGMMDFSPIVGILILVVVLNIFNTILSYGNITLGLIVSIILMAAWSAVDFLLTFFLIITVIRLVADLFSAASGSPFITTMETIISPLTNFVYYRLFKNSNISYRVCLSVTGVMLLVLLFLGGTLAGYLAEASTRIPF